MADPITDAFNWLDAALKADADLGPTIRLGNWIGGEESSELRARTRRLPADFDNIRIMPANGGEFPLRGARSGDVTNYRWTQVFAIQMSTGSTGFVTRLFPLKFNVLRALARAINATNKPSWLVNAQPIDVSESNDPAWVGVIALAVQMTVKSSDF